MKFPLMMVALESDLWFSVGLASRADQRVLRWFDHVERMDDYRIWPEGC